MPHDRHFRLLLLFLLSPAGGFIAFCPFLLDIAQLLLDLFHQSLVTGILASVIANKMLEI